MATVNCDKAIMVSLASIQRNVMLAMFGMSANDRTHMAEISIENSLMEIVQAETETRNHLQALVQLVRKRNSSRNCMQMKSDLLKSRNLRKHLCVLQQKRHGMEMQMDKLRESKLNMQMLHSMKHTNIALQNIGLKVSNADAIMLDLEEAHSDANALQNSMSMFEDDQDISAVDLEAELEQMLSEYALEPPQLAKTPRTVTVVPQLQLPDVAKSMGMPPDEPPAEPAQLEVVYADAAPQVYTDAVTPVSTMNETKQKRKVRGHKPSAAKELEEPMPA